jgi:hypothetical protein
MEFRLLFFMECWRLDLKFVAEPCFLVFLGCVIKNNAELLNGGWGVWWWKGINTK